jgi:hypothetical protein
MYLDLSWLFLQASRQGMVEGNVAGIKDKYPLGADGSGAYVAMSKIPSYIMLWEVGSLKKCSLGQ